MKNILLAAVLLSGCNNTVSDHLTEHQSIDNRIETIRMMCQHQMSEWCWQEYHRLERMRLNVH